MTTHPSAPIDRRDIVVGYDASRESRRALDWAADQADRLGRRLVVLTVVEPGEFGLNPAIASFRRFLHAEAHRVADPALDRVRRDHPAVDARIAVRVGGPPACLEHASRQAGLTVLGVRHRSMASRLLLGSVAHHLVRTVDTPLALVPAGTTPVDLGRSGTERVVAVVGPRAGGGAVRFALDQAAGLHRDLLVVRTTEPAAGGHAELGPDGLEVLLGARPEVVVEEQVVHGSATEFIRHGLAPADLLVVGNHEPGEERHLVVDRVVATLLHRPTCPVVVVPDTVRADASESEADTQVTA